MSDPMTNVQIEDVLSSIRKLVAEGDKSRAQPQAPKPAAQDRLILTPAHRVGAEGDVPPATVSEIAAGRKSMEATIAALEAAVSSDDGSWEPDGSEKEAEPTLVLKDAVIDPVDIVFEDDQVTEEAAAEPVAEPAPVSKPEPTTFRHFDRAALSQDDRLLKAMDLADAAALAGLTAKAEPVEDDNAETDFGDDMIADAMEDPQIDERLNAFLSDEAMLADAGLDEGVLRQLIIDIIREELQGALGERITRNVRKLVRREIARTLAAQDIE